MDRTSIAGPSSGIAAAAVPLLGTRDSGGNLYVRQPDGAVSGRRGRDDASRYMTAGSTRLMREQSMRVRESAREQLEERQSNWAYSRPVVVLDLIWNMAFVAVAAVLLVLSYQEQPASPLRVWVVGYALQCIIHMVCVWSEYGQRQRRFLPQPASNATSPESSTQGRLTPGSLSESEDHGRSSFREYITDEEVETEADLEAPEAAAETAGEEQSQQQMDLSSSAAKKLESANTMFSFVWWLVGFWWMLSGIDVTFSRAPLLSWLCTVFLAFDVFFCVFCVALACVIGIAVCCCLPCIIAILYAVGDQEGASEDDIKALPKYRFQKLPLELDVAGTAAAEKVETVGGVMHLVQPSQEHPAERKIAAENAECCICLSSYDDGAELRELPCTHHFHCSCIDKWLRSKPTCPLCKYDIVQRATAAASARPGTNSGSEAAPVEV